MANLGKWIGGVIGTKVPTTSWTAPNGIFPTENRNDGSAYSFTPSTSTLTLPLSGLADGYLIVASFETEDSSNGRYNPQAKIIQASGTGSFVGSPSGGYSRDNSEDRAYVRCLAFVDNPSALATFQFQWKRDTDVCATTDGVVRTSFEVIPFYYSDIGIFKSTDSSLLGGVTPTNVGSWTAVKSGNNITLNTNIVTVTGDNKRYLILNSQFFEGRGGRTQRWHTLEIDGVQEDGAKAYSYDRNTSNDETGDIFTHLLETATASITINQACYRGDGVASGQGGANIDGNPPAVGDHAMIVIELNDTAKVFHSKGSTNQNIATVGAIDIQSTKIADITINDADTFTRASDIAINVEKATDVLLGANVSAASQAVASGSRYTGFAEFTKNGIEDIYSVAGDYLRNNQSSTDTFGWSANLLSFMSVAQNDDIGVSATELVGSEGGGGAINIQSGWVGFWGVDLDSLEDSGTNVLVNTSAQSFVETIYNPTIITERNVSVNTSTKSLAESIYSPVINTSVNIQLNNVEVLEVVFSPLIIEGVGIIQNLSTSNFTETLLSPNVTTSFNVSVNINRVDLFEAVFPLAIIGDSNNNLLVQMILETLLSPSIESGAVVNLGTTNVLETLYPVSVLTGGNVVINLNSISVNEAIYSPNIQADKSTITNLTTQELIEDIYNASVSVGTSVSVGLSTQSFAETIYSPIITTSINEITNINVSLLLETINNVTVSTSSDVLVNINLAEINEDIYSASVSSSGSVTANVNLITINEAIYSPSIQADRTFIANLTTQKLIEDIYNVTVSGSITSMSNLNVINEIININNVTIIVDRNVALDLSTLEYIIDIPAPSYDFSQNVIINALLSELNITIYSPIITVVVDADLIIVYHDFRLVETIQRSSIELTQSEFNKEITLNEITQSDLIELNNSILEENINLNKNIQYGNNL